MTSVRRMMLNLFILFQDLLLLVCTAAEASRTSTLSAAVVPAGRQTRSLLPVPVIPRCRCGSHRGCTALSITFCLLHRRLGVGGVTKNLQTAIEHLLGDNDPVVLVDGHSRGQRKLPRKIAILAEVRAQASFTVEDFHA